MKPKILFLSRYQNKVARGVETFVAEISTRLAKDFKVKIMPDFSFPAVNQFKPNIIIPLNGGFQAFLSKVYCLLTGAKLIIVGQAGLGRPDRINLLMRPNIFVALTKRNAAWAKKHAYGVPLVTIPNGVDLTKFKPEGEKVKINLPRPIVFCVAGPEAYKRVSLTIEAVSAAKLSLLLVGGSNADEELGKKLLGDRFLRKSFAHKDLPAVYRAADVFTLASESFEAFGIVYLEALASGLPVVAPDDELRREILGEQGIFVKDIANVQAYAESLIKGSKSERVQAATWLRQFSWDHVAHQYAKLCLKLLSR